MMNLWYWKFWVPWNYWCLSTKLIMLIILDFLILSQNNTLDNYTVDAIHYVKWASMTWFNLSRLCNWIEELSDMCICRICWYLMQNIGGQNVVMVRSTWILCSSVYTSSCGIQLFEYWSPPHGRRLQVLLVVDNAWDKSLAEPNKIVKKLFTTVQKCRTNQVEEETERTKTFERNISFIHYL